MVSGAGAEAPQSFGQTRSTSTQQSQAACDGVNAPSAFCDHECMGNLEQPFRRSYRRIGQRSLFECRLDPRQPDALHESASHRLGPHARRLPTDQIDHVWGVEAGNGIGNLRPATHAENGQNQKTYRNNTSGFPGVYYRKDTGKQHAQINVRARRIYLGYFNTREEAYAAYCAAKAILHPFAQFLVAPRDRSTQSIRSK